MKLHYTRPTDVLSMELLGFWVLGKEDVKHIFNALAACAQEHGTRHILLDFAKSSIKMTEAEYKIVMSQLVVDLIATPIEKVARISTLDSNRESIVDSTYETMQAIMKLPLEFRSFQQHQDAFNWLLE
ncbi:hypothetical protein [Pontibacter vulgaris]|uniref:hypothetical protein n=1 Tax=Pontibacter vulgaris TaxID=2905679 RepID=UPI001FA6A9AF|nr:hypothetical protein [Pontibacter vulgaris]